MKSYDRCEISRLPIDTLSHVISLTSPKDACCCEAVCSAFRTASNSDAVWEHFIPLDIISRFVDPPPVFSSKKELFFHLCDHDTLIDNRTMTFRLDRKTGANMYIVRTIITWLEDPRYWQMLPCRDSRFGNAPTLLLVWWLDIHLTFNTKELSPETMYASYLIFKLEENSDGLDVPQQAFLNYRYQETSHTVCLQPEDEEMLLERTASIRFPKERPDGWMEMKLGEFYVNKGDALGVHMGLQEIETLNSKMGLIIEGIEIRPKEIDD